MVPFSAPNLSKYLIAQSRKPGKIAAFLKPCDTYSFQQLCKEHRIQRAAVYAVAVQCQGMCDIEQIKAQAKAPLAVREAGETLVVETLYGEKTPAPADGVGRAVLQLQNQKDGLL